VYLKQRYPDFDIIYLFQIGKNYKDMIESPKLMNAAAPFFKRHSATSQQNDAYSLYLR
jgi:hypothetical protein